MAVQSCLEKELKILDINVPKIISILENLGGTRVFHDSIHDTYFDSKQESKKGILKKDRKRLRIRRKGDLFQITMKQRIQTENFKQAYEEEYTIDDRSGVHDYVMSAGLKPIWEKYKTRITYLYEGIQFDIDMYPGIPPLLEIEGLTQEDIFYGIELLGLHDNEKSTRGAVGLFKRFNRVPLGLC